MDYEKYADLPVPVWGAVADTTRWGNAPNVLDKPVIDYYRQGVLFRGTSLDRLPTILTTGVDVTPTDAIIYCAELEKAYEYGKGTRVIAAYRWGKPGPDGTKVRVMGRAIVHVFDDTSPETRAEYEISHPYVLPTQPGAPQSRCRVEPETAARRGYLGPYGKYLTGDPFDALVAILIYGSPEGLADARAVLAEHPDVS